MIMSKHTISKVVETVYCEQKAVFDADYGDARPQRIRYLAKEGIRQHAKFEADGHKPTSPCYVATRVFGEEAYQTQYLRAWRDAVLLPHKAGRYVVEIYYVVSPKLLRCLPNQGRIEALLRRVLDRALRAGLFDYKVR